MNTSDQEPSLFEVRLSAFSGPLDLLCHLIERRELDASRIKVTELVSQYVAFALKTKRASLQELAEFFFMASRLMLGKVRSLFPATDDESDSDSDVMDDFEDIDESALLEALKRFRPYRAAVVWMAEQQRKRESHFLRIQEGEGPPWFDMGDLYGLAQLWWSTIDEYKRRRSNDEDLTEDYFMEEIPDAIPEEVLVEQRMGDIVHYLNEVGTGTLGSIFRVFPDSGLIVTLLALLELSRLGKINLKQVNSWGDVNVVAC